MGADVLLITVTEVEGRAVLESFRNATNKDAQAVQIGTKLYHDLGEVNQARIYMVQSEMGAGGIGAAHQTVQKGIDALSPSAIVMVGIAFGINPQKQAVGDVLIGRQILLYDLQRIGTNKKGQAQIIPRGDRPHASSWLVNRFQSAKLSWQEDVSVHIGLILSGEKLIDNIDFRQQLQKLEPEAIGGEMEGAGLYAASQDGKVDWIICKGICDWADGNKNRNRSKRQVLAARNATRFLLHVLLQAPLRLNEGPRQTSPGTTNSSKVGAGASVADPLAEALTTAPIVPTAVAFAHIGLEHAQMPFLISICLISDEPQKLSREIGGWKKRLLRDPLLPQAVKGRLKEGRLNGLFDEPAVRMQVLTWLSTTSFSAYLYYARRADVEHVPPERLRWLMLVEPLVHRMSKKSEAITRALSDRLDLPQLVNEAAKEVKKQLGRVVVIPEVSVGRSDQNQDLWELSHAIACICLRHFVEPLNEDATVAFEHVRTRMRFAQNVVTGERHTRDRNPLP